MTQPGICPLSPRELDCLKSAAQDRRAKETARELGVSHHFVARSLDTAKLKAHTKTIPGLIAKALREGWIE